jgi:dipeptidyl aminopeptidase/acylaminoacyl peptidase
MSAIFREPKMKKYAAAFLLILNTFFVNELFGQKFVMSIENIMRDSRWMGSSPENMYWSEDGSGIYFTWNRTKADDDSLFFYSVKEKKIKALTAGEQKQLPSNFGSYNLKRTLKTFEKNGDIFILDLKTGEQKQLINSNDRESNPKFSPDGIKIYYMLNGNLFSRNLKDGAVVQLTDFRKGNKPQDPKENLTDQEKSLNKEELSLFNVLRERKEERERREKKSKLLLPERAREIYVQDKNVNNVQISPDGNFITFRLDKSPKNSKNTIVPNYVTERGFTEDINARTKVGGEQTTYEFGIYDLRKDTVYFAETKTLPGIYEKPEYLNDSKPKSDSAKKEIKKERPREVLFSGPVYSDDGTGALMVLKSLDNKDRWIVLLDLSSGRIKNLDRQHDDEWIGGPGIGWGTGNTGWLADSRRVYFQSEASGYSHLYTLNTATGEKKQLTKGNYEVSDPQLSRDKKYFYFTSNEVHPGERHFYRIPVDGGKAEKITTMTGNNEAALSPDETRIAVRHSYSNKPWELYVMENSAAAEPEQITKSTTDEFNSYPWRDPQIVTFKAEDGENVYARLYKPNARKFNKAAVLFVHGAGYLQNAHKWWSDYYREYMFNNFLADSGYTVLDIDYRASSGYGKKWRTDIYRNMGGKDLSDHVDGVKFLVENYNIDPKKIGIYGGSYGGFITLMAMFKEPSVFAAGAALRPVTDWAHYNHGYTANILNIPVLDSASYKKSSPIYYAGGLKGALLICHGVVDDNVHFQDAVRLSQKLIELGKENWELAIYPAESHGFREPSSWTDEYKRIFKLFEQNINKK